jgi:hypothetical protein
LNAVPEPRLKLKCGVGENGVQLRKTGEIDIYGNNSANKPSEGAAGLGTDPLIVKGC